MLFMLSLVVGTVLISEEMIEEAARSLAQREIPVLDKAHQLKLSVIQVQQWLTDISATRGLDGLNDGFDEAANNAKLFHQLIGELTAIDPDNSTRYQAMTPAFENYYAVGKRMARAYIDQGPMGGNKMMAQFDEAAATMAEQVNEFVATAQNNAQTLLATEDATIHKAKNTTIILSLLLLAAVILVFRLLLGIVKVIPYLNKTVNRVAAGNLTDGDLVLHREDEIGELATTINSMKHSLHGVIENITHVAHELAASAKTYSSKTTETLKGVLTQKSDIHQIASTMNEMAVIASEIAKNADDTSKAAQQANHQSQEVNQVVNQSINAINGVAEEIKTGVTTITALCTQSDQIGGILDVIRNIADQTNLLALNAAIEAARAGEQGRGFAVVANEVRTLAQRTQEATREIQTMIESLQQSAHGATKVIEHSHTKAQESVDQIHIAKETLKAVSQAIHHITQMSAKIGSATHQQSTVSEELNRNISSINDVCENTSERTESLSTASHQLESLADEMSTIVSRFKV